MNLIIFILICFGWTSMMLYGSLFESFREWWKEKFKGRFFGHFWECSLCAGMWIGMIVFLLFWFSGIKLFPNVYIGCFLFGCLSSGTSNFLCSIFDDWGIKISLTNKKD